MDKWHMTTFVGKDQSGIVAKVTLALFQGKCNLGEASMTRLGGSFTMMMMVSFDGTEEELEKIISPICKEFGLRGHVDKIKGELYRHADPDVRIRIYEADKAAIVASATGVLTEAGLNILSLETEVGGDDENPVYVMKLEGMSENGIDALEITLGKLEDEQGVQTHITSLDTSIG
jgi:glycine cleavage system transcriptional repressor